MSQIETIMLVTLGFVVAALLALFLGRLIWSYAVTLGKRRTERSAPATIAALQAERDQLRAEYAMLSRKLELRLEDLKTRLAEQTAEVSRNRNRIDHLIKEVEKRNTAIAERDEQIDQLNKHIEPLEAELATRTQAMQQLKEQLRNRDEELTSSTGDRNQFEGLILDRDREIAALRSELINRPMPGESTPEAHSANERLQQQIDELTTLSDQIEQQRSQTSEQYDEFTSQQDEPATSHKSTSRSGKKTKRTRQGAAKPKKPSTADGTAETVEPDDGLSTTEARIQQDVDEKVKSLQRQGQNLEQQIQDAERETDQLQDELKQLDEVWSEKISALSDATDEIASSKSESTDPPNPDDNDTEKQAQPAGRSRQNVISLAARIRALQGKSVEN